MTGQRPFLLGLTGSIGMGKSTTARMLADRGVPVWDADAAVHRLYAPGGAAVGPVSALCPAALKGGGIDRAALRDWIARDPGALKRIEAVVHPLVAEDRARFIAEESAEILAFDIPLLYETGAETWLDGVAVVSTEPDKQRQRVLARPGATEDMFKKILSKQIPDSEKRRRADFVITTDTLETASCDVDDMLARIREAQDA